MKPVYRRYRPVTHIRTKISFVILVRADLEWLDTHVACLDSANWFWSCFVGPDSRVGSYLLAETP